MIQPSPTDPRSEPSWLPSLRDPLVLFVLALVFALQLWSWNATEGYQLADSVEFMERARSLERGQAMIDSVAIRPFGFSAVLVPFFAIADWIGLPDPRAIGWSICILQMLLGLGLVVVTMRIGGRIGGRRAGVLAGVIAGANPIFLQYSSQPVSGLAAGICAGLALEAILDRASFRSGIRSGLWLGAAFLMAFQSLLIAAPIVLLLLLRDGVVHRKLLPATVRGILCGVACALLAQVLIDWASFGKPGASLANYVAQNFGSVVTSFLARIGLRPLAVSFYKFMLALQGSETVVAENAPLAAKQSPWFYLVELPRMLVWPAIAAFALGLARGVARPSWKIALPAIAFLLNVLAMSNKGSKDFRLWLPLLPWIAALCAFGWTWIPLQRKGARTVLDLSFSVALVVLGCAALVPLGSRRFAGFWRAMDWVDSRAQAIVRARATPSSTNGAKNDAGNGERARPRVRVAGVYNWSVYLRDTAEVDLVKLPWQLDLWSRYQPEQRAEDLRVLAGLDLFIAHVPLLTETPELFDFLSSRFEVAAAVYDPTIDLARLGPILVFEQRNGRPGENLLAGSGVEGTRPASDVPAPVHFVGSGAEGRTESIELEGWRYSRLPPQGLGWITYWWSSPTGLSRDYLLRDRITCPDDTFAWQDQNHGPAWGRRPTSTWKPGEIVGEGYLAGPYRPIGAELRDQGEAPAGLWFSVVDLDPQGMAHGQEIVRAELAPARRGEDRPIAQGTGREPSETPDGIRFSGDGFVRVAAFRLPLPDDASHSRDDSAASR